MLAAVFGKQVVGRTQVLEWFFQFTVVHPLWKLPKSLGCPPRSTISTCVDRMKTTVLKNRRITLREVAHMLEIPRRF